MENNIPKLRFPEFDGEWEKKRLGSISKINPKTEKLPNSFIYIDLESVIDGQLLKEERIELINAPSRAQRLLSSGDILFQMVRPYQKNNLFFNRNGEYVASTGYAQIKTDKNPKYIYQYLHFQKFTDKVIERCTGTSYPAINSTDLSNILISISSLPEQTKIANFLTAVDDKLTQLKKKKSLLEQYKKGVMQQILSQELRFKNDDGSDFAEWKEKTLGQITYKVGKKNKDSIKYPIYSINNKEGFKPQSDQFDGMDSNARGYDISLYKIVESNTFAYNPARINVGSIGYCGSLNNVIISSLYVCFKTVEDVNDYFLLQFISTPEFNNSVLTNVEGGVRQYLFYENFSNIEINLPSLPEQTKIANFLSAIDDKIGHCNTQIEKMETWKKGLLQQMFV